MGQRAPRWFGRTDGGDLLHPFILKRRLPGPRRERFGSIFELPPQGYLFELRVTAWQQTPPPRPHDHYMAAFGEDELRLARRLARQLRVPWDDDPLTGLPRELARQIRRLRAAQKDGRRGVTLWLLRVEELHGLLGATPGVALAAAPARVAGRCGATASISELGGTGMTADDTEERSRRATVHFWAWNSLHCLARAAGFAQGSTLEPAAREARQALERFLGTVEAEATATGAPLGRSLHLGEENSPAEQVESAGGGRPPTEPQVSHPPGGMTFEEFVAWERDEPDRYELVDGVPVRMPTEKQGGRRIDRVFAAAELALGADRVFDWGRSPCPALGGRRPYLVASESWQGLVEVIELLCGVAPVADRDSDDNEWMFAPPGQSLHGLLEEALRMAAIERARAAGGSEKR